MSNPDHIAIVSSDDRGRLGLAKWIRKQAPYKVYVHEDGTVTLKPQEVKG